MHYIDVIHGFNFVCVYSTRNLVEKQGSANLWSAGGIPGVFIARNKYQLRSDEFTVQSLLVLFCVSILIVKRNDESCWIRMITKGFSHYLQFNWMGIMIKKRSHRIFIITLIISSLIDWIPFIYTFHGRDYWTKIDRWYSIMQNGYFTRLYADPLFESFTEALRKLGTVEQLFDCIQ